MLNPQREMMSQNIEEFFGGTGVSPVWTQAKSRGSRKYPCNANPVNLSEPLTVNHKPEYPGPLKLLLLTAYGSLLTLTSQ
jgi:hypothetical protein